jgi:flagellar motor switch protein FliM
MNKILNQDEVDALLRGLQGEEIEAENDVVQDDSDVVPFDLDNQDRIIRGRMPVLEIINDRFARHLSGNLGTLLRKRLEVNPISVDMTKFGEFMRSLPVPTSINLFKMNPLRGSALLVIDTRLVFAFVENFFGGSGTQPKVEGREFTPIEQGIIKKVVLTSLRELEHAWHPIHEIEIEFQRSEINPQFASIIPPSDVVVVVTFEIELENAVGNLIVALPYATIEPIRSKLYASYQSERLEIDQTWLNRMKERLMDTPLELVVNLGTTTLTTRQLLDLDEGDILVLDTDLEDDLMAKVEGLPKFRGKPGKKKGNKAFLISQEEKSVSFD